MRHWIASPDALIHEPRVLVELEREEHVAARDLTIEREIQERVVLLIDVGPRVEEVRLARRHTVRISEDVPMLGIVLMRTRAERRIQRIRIARRNQPRLADKALPVTQQALGILIAITALEIGPSANAANRSAQAESPEQPPQARRTAARQRGEQRRGTRERAGPRRTRHQRIRANHVPTSLPAGE